MSAQHLCMELSLRPFNAVGSSLKTITVSFLFMDATDKSVNVTVLGTTHFLRKANGKVSKMFKMTGLKEFQNKLEALSRNAERLDGQHQIPITELLTNSFVSKHTSFASLDEMFEASGFKVESQEDFAAIPDDELDAFICQNSGFADWASMIEAASEKWVAKQLGL